MPPIPHLARGARPGRSVRFFNNKELSVIEGRGSKEMAKDMLGGLTLKTMAEHYRQMQERLAEVDPEWRVSAKT